MEATAQGEEGPAGVAKPQEVDQGQEEFDQDHFPLLSNAKLPINRENLGLPERARPDQVEVIKGRLEDYKFDLDRQQAIQKEEIQKQHTEYLEAHPELKEIVSDLLCSLMLEKPTDVYKYFAEYFKGTK